MKQRSLLKLGVFLLLGAAVNVAVAWGFALSVDLLRNPSTCSVAWWQTADPMGRASHVTIRSRCGAFAFGADESVRMSDLTWQEYPEILDAKAVLPRFVQSRHAPGDSFSVETFGWPLPALWYEYLFIPAKNAMVTDVARGGLPVFERHAGFTNVVAVPMRPIWPGFAINTIFYAGVCWLLFAAPFAVRRRRRIKRGLCPACAYPVGSSDVCTECGKPVSVRPERGDGM